MLGLGSWLCRSLCSYRAVQSAIFKDCFKVGIGYYSKVSYGALKMQKRSLMSPSLASFKMFSALATLGPRNPCLLSRRSFNHLEKPMNLLGSQSLVDSFPTMLTVTRNVRTRSCVKKRFRVTGSGALKYKHSNMQHMMRKRSRRKNRKLSVPGKLEPGHPNFNRTKRMLGF